MAKRDGDRTRSRAGTRRWSIPLLAICGVSSVYACEPTQTAAECFADDFVNPGAVQGPDYDQYAPRIGNHCEGTNHQNITGVERVVFLGDSITVGTPPSLAGDFYRSRLALALAQKFRLTPPDPLWLNADVVEGTSLVRTSGAFSSCAEWGARTDDFAGPGKQLETCFPESERGKRTLVIITMGGNDLASIAKKGVTASPPYSELRAQGVEYAALMRDAVTWLKSDPARFPNGVFVIFSNTYEFTDGSGDTRVCPTAALAGLGEPWQDPGALREILVAANQEYMKIAVDTNSDMIFLQESFCGHGWSAANPSAPCYRGPFMENWFDVTCIHPTPNGHARIANMFMSIVNE